MPIPKKIHQTWKTKDIPYDTYSKQWVDSWKIHHPDWEYQLWTDDEMREMVRVYYPNLLGMYDRYHWGVQRADAFRYLLLHKFGGIYVDLDCLALKPIDALFENTDIFFGQEPDCNAGAAGVEGLFISNAFMGSVPNHPFLEHTVNRLNRCANQKGILESTGPVFLTNSFNCYPEEESIKILDQKIFLWSFNFIKGDCDYKSISYKGGSISEDTYVLHFNSIVWV